MFGTFQSSSLRIEIPATAAGLRASLLYPEALRQWLAPVRLPLGLPESLQMGTTYTSWVGAIAIQHQVDYIEANALRLVLSRGIDGFHEWYWGDGWVQSRLEGVSLLPLGFSQMVSLLQLKRFLAVTQPQPH